MGKDNFLRNYLQINLIRLTTAEKSMNLPIIPAVVIHLLLKKEKELSSHTMYYKTRYSERSEESRTTKPKKTPE